MKIRASGSFEKPVSELLDSTPNLHRSLWERAEGRLGWGFVVGSLVAVALLAYGFSGDFANQGKQLLALAFGVMILCQSEIFREKARSAAMRQLIKRMEERVTRLEKAAYSGR